MLTVQLPASWVSRGYETPSCCARHGGPATVTRRVRIARRAPAWLAGLGGAVMSVVMLLLGSRIVAPAWPFCDECGHERRLRLAVGGALCAAAPLPYGAVLATAPVADFAAVGNGQVVLTALMTVALLAGGLSFLAAAAWGAVCGAYLSRDDEWVLVSPAHPRFAKQVSLSVAGETA